MIQSYVSPIARMAKKKLQPGGNKIEISLSTLANGVYPYKVIVNDELKVSDKLIIVK